MKPWYQNSRRRTLMDMHIDDWNPVFLSEFSPERYVDSLCAANISAPMIYVQAHTGLCYWPTQSGRMHRGLEGREDCVRRVFELCHQKGMDTIAYYSLVYNNWAYDTYPAWRMKTVDGLSSRELGKRYGFCCPNNRDYVEFTKRQMGEFFSYFPFEGLFMDMVFWPFICYCDSCKKRWREEIGGEMPTVINWADPRWQLFQKTRERWIDEFSAEITAEAKRLKPSCSVEHQYQTAIKFWRFGGTENIARNSDYAGGDRYGGFAEQSFACKLYHTLSRNQPFEYMTCRCYPRLKEHTTNKSDDQLELGIMLTQMHHGASLVIDAVDPSGTHDPRVYEKLGAIYDKVRRMERHLESGSHRVDVGVYFNLKGKMDPAQRDIPVGEPDEFTEQYPHLEAAMGAAAALRTHHIPFTVVNNWKLAELVKGLQVLAICDAPNISPEELDVIRSFVASGGKLYLSGISAPELVKEMLHITPEGYTQETTMYVAPAKEHTKEFLGYFTEKYPLTMMERAVVAAGTPKGEVLATLTKPYTIPNPIGIWDDVGTRMPTPHIAQEDPRYPFASIHSDPPGIATELPALIRAPYGCGTVIWSALPIERPDRFQHRDIFASLISDMLDQPPWFTCSAAETAECVLFEDEAAKTMTVGLANIQEGFRFIPVHNVKVSVRTETPPKRVVLLPEETPVAYSFENGYTTFHVEELRVAEIFLLEK